MKSSPFGTIAHISSYSITFLRTLDKAWDRFQEMLRRCSHHDFPRGKLIQIFYSTLSTLSQASIDITCGRIIRKKSPRGYDFQYLSLLLGPEGAPQLLLKRSSYRGRDKGKVATLARHNDSIHD
ncbi:hypothetical protein CR513_07272, partial [Mucuna pruriens]